MWLLEEAVLEYFGERCPDFDQDCMTCQAWRQLDQAKYLESLCSKKITDIIK